MIRLALLEAEYGKEITRPQLKKREYVKGRMFIFFLLESLLYLCFAMFIFSYIFLDSKYTISVDNLIIIGGILFFIYIWLCVIGLSMVKKRAINRYDLLSEEIKKYKEGLQELYEMMKYES